MTQTAQPTAPAKSSNSLVFKTDKIVKKEHIFVTIRLNDECKNGHQDFAITASIYEAGKPKTDRYFISAGCCHEDILAAFPEFKLFVDLHLCDYLGNPMHAIANGFYHLRNGFNKTKPEDKTFRAEYCEYYRITPAQFNRLYTAHSQTHFAILLAELGIPAQWKRDADEAIKFLEELTGTAFVVDSVKNQLYMPTDEELKAENDKINNQYYSPEAAARREQEKQAGLLAELKADRDKEINKAHTEFDVKKQVLIHGGERALKNCIFYNHTKELSFNWKSYDLISEELVNVIKENAVMPEGVTITDKKGK